MQSQCCVDSVQLANRDGTPEMTHEWCRLCTWIRAPSWWSRSRWPWPGQDRGARSRSDWCSCCTRYPNTGRTACGPCIPTTDQKFPENEGDLGIHRMIWYSIEDARQFGVERFWNCPVWAVRDVQIVIEGNLKCERHNGLGDTYVCSSLAFA
jgi:hypothetical protein